MHNKENAIYITDYAKSSSSLVEQWQLKDGICYVSQVLRISGFLIG